MLSSLILLLSFSSIQQAPGAMALTCGSVTRSRIELAVGRPLAPEAEEHSKFESTCSYAGGDVSVTISIHHLAQSLDLPAELATLKATFPGSELHEVKGLGWRAFALDIPGVAVQLHVIPEEREYFLVSVEGVEDGHHGFDAAAKIARAVMSHRETEDRSLQAP